MVLAAGLLSKFNGRILSRHSRDPTRLSPSRIRNSGSNDSTIVRFGRLFTEELSRRQEQDCTEKRNQHPYCVCLGNDRDLVPTILVTVVLAVIAFTVIRAGVG